MNLKEQGMDMEAVAAQTKALVGSITGELAWASAVLAGRLGAAEKRCAELEAELAELKKAEGVAKGNDAHTHQRQ